MVATFLQGELSSERFGPAVRDQLAAMSQPEALLTRPDLADPQANAARRDVLAATRGYGENGELFEFFPACVDGSGGTWCSQRAFPECRGRPLREVYRSRR